MLNLFAFWCWAQPAASLPDAEAILGLQCIVRSLQGSCKELHVADGYFSLTFAGTVMADVYAPLQRSDNFCVL